ncbi:alpha/beta hydrolase [Hoyosella subflava]|uniref:Putative lipase n=1 Tax=Hoyosella subflava (strain DSM 45089 / JCM 17490 / NBRC 109087 / DQS3-9A1) TaxID=443218 RepID=F6EPC2_HOYSD|nr:alpha/beta hydrolase [Hoyosella subflava]AEF41782.1 putative lipase [Hoyosella subflava DQS3-9A1]
MQAERIPYDDPSEAAPAADAEGRAFTVHHGPPSARSRLIWWCTWLFVRPLFLLWPLGVLGFSLIVALSGRVDRRLTARGKSSRCTYTPAELGGCPAEWVSPRNSRLTANRPVILYLHGGGFYFGGLGTHRPICTALALAVDADVVSVAYRQLPDGGVGTSVADAIKAYEELNQTARPTRKIFVAGDSAGGYLTMKVGELAARRNLHVPDGLIGFSPLLSMFPERYHVARPAKDAYLPARRVVRVRRHWLSGDVPVEGVLSPLHASDLITSPVFLTAAHNELLATDIYEFGRELHRRGVRVEVHAWIQQLHAFPAMVYLVPEAQHAVDETAAFVRSIVHQER